MKLSARRFLLIWVGGSLMLMMLIGLSSSHSSQFHAATHHPQGEVEEGGEIEQPAEGEEGAAPSGSNSGSASAEETPAPPPVKKGKGKAKRAVKAQAAEEVAEPVAAAEVPAKDPTDNVTPAPPPPETDAPKKAKGKGKKSKKHGKKGGGGHHSAVVAAPAVVSAARAAQMWEGIDSAKYSHVAIMHTDDGDIVLGLRGDAAPKSVANFVHLAESGWYNNSCFYRYEKGFVLQGGSCGGVNQRVEAPTVPLEYQLPNAKYTIALARTSDPNSGSSEFFINLRDNTSGLGPAKKGGYAVFGDVLKGIDNTIPAMKKRPVVVKKGALTRFVKGQAPKIHWIEVAPHA